MPYLGFTLSNAFRDAMILNADVDQLIVLTLISFICLNNSAGKEKNIFGMMCIRDPFFRVRQISFTDPS